MARDDKAPAFEIMQWGWLARGSGKRFPYAIIQSPDGIRFGVDRLWGSWTVFETVKDLNQEFTVFAGDEKAPRRELHPLVCVVIQKRARKEEEAWKIEQGDKAKAQEAEEDSE